MGCGASVQDIEQLDQLNDDGTSLNPLGHYSEREMSTVEAEGIIGEETDASKLQSEATPGYGELRSNRGAATCFQECQTKQLTNMSDFPDLCYQDNIMAKCLTEDIWKKLRNRRTTQGVTIEHICQTGISNPTHASVNIVGCVAGDEESYDTFAELFDPVIEKCHSGYKKNTVQIKDLDPKHLVGRCQLDPNYVVSCAIGTSRNIRGYCLPPRCTRAERRDIEAILTHALCSFGGDLAGRYYPLNVLKSEYHEVMFAGHHLFEKPTSPYMLSSGMARDWPDARGLWHNQDWTFLVGININEHCKLISVEKTGNVGRAFERFCRGVSQFEQVVTNEEHEFMFNKHKGYIHACPGNLGTGVHASILIKLPLLCRHERFQQILSLLRLHARETEGTDCDAASGMLDISNMDTHGLSEVDIVQRVVDGVNRLIQMEKISEAGESIDGLVPIFLQHSRTDYPDLADHHSFMARCLSPELYHHLMPISTTSGFTFSQAIQWGVDDPGSPVQPVVGCVAGDEHSYEVFADLFQCVIAACFNESTMKRSRKAKAKAAELKGVENIDSDYVKAVRIHGSRSLRGFCMSPHICRSERRTVEEIVLKALNSMDGISCKYCSLKAIAGDDKTELQEKQVWFDKPTSVMAVSSGVSRDWPDARGVWLNSESNIAVWVNEIDHCRFTIIQDDGNVETAFHTYQDTMKRFEEIVQQQGHELARNDHLGYLVACPDNIGTAMSATVHIRLPSLGQDTRFDGLLRSLGLTKKAHVEPGKTEPVHGEFDITIGAKLGMSEAQQLQLLIDGVLLLTDMDKQCENLESLMPSDYQDESGGEDLESTITFKVVQLKSSNMPVLTSSHNNWMAQCLTEDMYQKLQFVLTSTHFTFDEMIQEGVDHPGSECCMSVGVVAGDEDSYQVFAGLMDRIIEGRHSYFWGTKHKSDLHPERLKYSVEELDPDFVLSCRVRTCRSIRPFALPPNNTRQERRLVERVMMTALASREDPFHGTYIPLRDIDSEVVEELISANFLHKLPEMSSFVSSGMARDWPDARGFWHSADKKLYAWLNLKDHARIVSIEKGGNMKAVFERFCKCVKQVSASVTNQGLEFMWSDHLGYINANPSNLGTGLRASVHIKLQKLPSHHKFGAILESLRLEKRGKTGVDDLDPVDGIYDISNLDRIGTSEVEQVQTVIHGVQLLIKMEKLLLEGKALGKLMPEQAKNFHLPEDSITELGREIIQRSHSD